MGGWCVLPWWLLNRSGPDAAPHSWRLREHSSFVDPRPARLFDNWQARRLTQGCCNSANEIPILLKGSDSRVIRKSRKRVQQPAVDCRVQHDRVLTEIPTSQECVRKALDFRRFVEQIDIEVVVDGGDERSESGRTGRDELVVVTTKIPTCCVSVGQMK